MMLASEQSVRWDVNSVINRFNPCLQLMPTRDGYNPDDKDDQKEKVPARSRDAGFSRPSPYQNTCLSPEELDLLQKPRPRPAADALGKEGQHLKSTALARV